LEACQAKRLRCEKWGVIKSVAQQSKG